MINMLTTSLIAEEFMQRRSRQALHQRARARTTLPFCFGVLRAVTGALKDSEILLTFIVFLSLNTIIGRPLI